MPADLRDSIQSALASFAEKPLRNAATDLFRTLGYDSDRKLDWTLDTFLDLTSKAANPLTEKESAALKVDVGAFNLLFQLTDAEIVDSSQVDLFESRTAVDTTKIFSYLVIACDLKRERYNRTDLARLVRLINKPLPMPALVLFKHGDTISLAVLHRRLNKRQADKDVLEKATLIKDIRFVEPIRAHLEILQDFSLSHLAEDFGFHNFVSLHEAWRKRLDTFALNDKFYQEIADWYFWAQHLIAEGKIVPPRDADTEAERSLFLIRLLTRLIFCWFLLEKRLLPANLFREKDLRKLLKDFSPDSTSYYKAVLQNLFFATLNQPQADRSFRGKSAGGGFDANRGATNLWRYADHFADAKDWPSMVKTVPFLNGGLFDCLDHVYQKVEKQNNTRLDDFSEEKANTVHLPNDLFFGPERTVDLSADYGEEGKKAARSKKAKVRGLIEILSRYKFTIEENTPLDEEIALDPELLGKVFENLLASYNEETRTTARKATGSFYTPREVVSYMVDEALIAYLEPILTAKDKQAKLRTLFDSRLEDFHTPFTPDETTQLITALDSVKIFDPACGSGAFPMGALNRLVDLLAKLDPTNRLWIALQQAKARKVEGWTADERKEAAAMWGSLAEDDRFEADYVRKLALIEQSIFGADIQPVAVQIAKLRFFISLICDQKTDPKSDNSGILPLPNLETRIVAANTLLPIQGAVTGAVTQAHLMDYQVDALREELRRVRHDHFQARNPAKKKKCRDRDKELRDQIAAILKSNDMPADAADKLAAWDPYDQNEAAPFFDPVWMFGTAYTRPATPAITLAGEFASIINAAQYQQELTASKSNSGSQKPESGFEIVIGNPPYVRQEKIKDQKEALKDYYQCFTGTADLYVYFYERALQLLRTGGILSYITSNSFLNSAFGDKLRGYLASQTTLLSLIDFAETKVFTAITEPCILITRKGSPTKNSFRALKWEETQRPERIAEIAAKDAFPIPQQIFSNPPWQLEPPKTRRILDNLSANTTTLGSLVRNRILYGIKTGLNEAFVVDTVTRNQLVNEHNDCSSLIRPFLAGKDLKRWQANQADRWMILIPSSENAQHTWSGQPLAEAERTFRRAFPSVYSHLLPFRDRLIKRQDQGKYFWELRSCAYYDEFSKPKIVYQDIARSFGMSWDESGAILVNTCYFIPGVEKWVLAELLSPVIAFWVQRKLGHEEGGFLRLFTIHVQEFPVAAPSAEQKEMIESLTTAQLWLSAQSSIQTQDFPRDPAMREFYERLLNGLVYELYLPEELHEAGLHLFDLVEAAQLPDLDALPAAKSDPKQKLRLLREKFEELADLRHPIRAALQKLSTLDSVRIIEGKA
ncbi:Eco57I restriction-modification methylase domain-containing protein [Parvibaculum sp.]|uniref:Eco57I restriction-modification methylase domain-containing protein n=1 Tax=Parvibaculum sp. TaxID=2024848 RepID=UPI003BAB0BD0